MSSRISSALLLLLLTACGGPSDRVKPANDIAFDTATGAPAGVDRRIECALGGGDFARVCSLDRAPARSGSILTIRHPDGGFRRLVLAADDTITTADGAAPAKVRRDERGVEVDVDGARYRLSAEAISSAAP